MNYMMLNVSRTCSVSQKFTEQYLAQGIGSGSRNIENEWNYIHSQMEEKYMSRTSL